MKLRGVGAPLTKSIIFVIVTSLATGILALSIANRDVGDRTGYNARFIDVTGLIEGDGVRVAGVRIGQVDKISVVDRRLANVRFSIEKNRRLPGGVTASIKYLNLVGQRYIELERGTGTPGRNLRPGGTIPPDRTTPALNLTQLFNGFQPLFQALSPEDVNKLSGEIVQVLQGEGTTVDTLLTTVGELTSGIASKDQVIGQVVDNLNVVLDTINSRGDRLADFIITLRKLTSGLAADRKPIGEALSAIGDLTNTAADLLRDSRPPLKGSIDQLGRLTGNLNDDSPIVERFLRRLPGKTAQIARLGSYGSWLNLYMCQALVSGAKYAPPSEGEPRPAPTGIPVTETRCKG